MILVISVRQPKLCIGVGNYSRERMSRQRNGREHKLQALPNNNNNNNEERVEQEDENSKNAVVAYNSYLTIGGN